MCKAGKRKEERNGATPMSPSVGVTECHGGNSFICCRRALPIAISVVNTILIWYFNNVCKAKTFAFKYLVNKVPNSKSDSNALVVSTFELEARLSEIHRKCYTHNRSQIFLWLMKLHRQKIRVIHSKLLNI